MSTSMAEPNSHTVIDKSQIKMSKLSAKMKEGCSRRMNANYAKSFIFSMIPILQWFPVYNWRQNLVTDILGGMTDGIMSIPQGMAYAELAGMPIVSGLYINIIPTAVYAFFGTSWHAAIGSSTVPSMMMGSLKSKILPCDDCWTNHSNNATDGALNGYFATPMEIGCATAFLVGCILLAMGLAHLDIINVYLSEQLINGFTIGVVIHVFFAQLGAAFGVPAHEVSGVGKIIIQLINFVKIIHMINYVAAGICWSSVCVLLFIKMYLNPKILPIIRIQIPGELVVVVAGCLISHYGNLKQSYGVAIVGYIPPSLPLPVAPRFDLMRRIFVDCLIIAIVTYCQSVSQVKLYARKHNYTTSDRQEFFAYGSMNVVGSFFQCFNSSLSVSRTMVLEKTGSKSQVAALIGIVIVVLTILLVAPYLYPLPQAILASIIIAACIDMFCHIKEALSLWRTSKFDLAIYLATIIGIVTLDVTLGLLFSVMFAFFTVVLRTQRRKPEEISKLPVTNASPWHYSAEQLESAGIRFYRFDAPLYFANIESFKSDLNKKCFNAVNTRRNGENLEKPLELIDQNQVEKPAALVHHVIIDSGGMTYIDIMGANALEQIFYEFKDKGIRIYVANANSRVQKTMRKLNHFGNLMPEHYLYPSVVDAAVEALGCNTRERIGTRLSKSSIL